MSSPKPVQIRERRRSTRIDRGIALIVKGADALKVPYQEFALTRTINCHGCRYQTKHEIVPGETVQMDVVHTEDGHPGGSAQARVKWITPLEHGNEASHFDVAVELEAPGNVWGIAKPPQDWSVLEWSRSIDRMGPSDNAYAESSSPFAPAVETAQSSKQRVALTNSAVLASVPQLMAQFVDGLSTQTQMIAAEAATLVIREGKDRWLGDLRAEFQAEVPKMIERLVAAAKNELVSQTMKEVKEAQEVAVRASYEEWTKAIRQEMENASLRFDSQRSDTVGQIESMAASTIEQLKRNMDLSRRQAVENCISQLRSQLVPLFEQVNAKIEDVKGAERELKTNTLTACNAFQQVLKHEHERVTSEIQGKMAELRREFDDYLEQRMGVVRNEKDEHERVTSEMQGKTAEMRKQFENYVDNRIAAVLNELGQESCRSIAHTRDALAQLSQTSESNAKQHFESLFASAVDEINSLHGKTREYASKMEGYSRRQLQFVSELLAKFASPDEVSSQDSGQTTPKP